MTVASEEWLEVLAGEHATRVVKRLQQLLRSELSTALGLAPDASLGLRESFVELGLQSLQAVEVKAVLERRLLCQLSNTLLFDYPTLEALAEYLAHEVLGSRAAVSGESDDAPEPVDAARYANYSVEQLRLLLARSERKLQRREQQASMPIAIVGMACRLPAGIEAPDQLWSFLQARGDGITEVPPERWDAATYYDPTPGTAGKVCTRSGGFLSDVDKFDADLFGVSPREAEQVDPQQRLLLEVTRAALEDAGEASAQLRGSRTGVFVGMRGSEYHTACLGRDPRHMSAHMGTGGAPSAGAGRISYTFGLRGPSVSTDTACSSALVAVHQAIQSMRLGECEGAIVAAVNLVLDPLGMVALSQARMLSPNGRCFTFDARADGYVRAEGCVAMYLKPLAAAQRDGNRVYAVLRGSAVNQDGASGGLTVPSGPAQEAVVREALRAANIRPYQVAYVEAHGTGTLLGDPIEVQALNNVFSPDRHHGLPLFIGSIKANIGHLEMAAGLAGLLKVALALHKQAMVPQVGFQTPNPLIQWSRGVAQVVTTQVEWPRGEVERVAGVSSFGFAGTNAHVVVSEAPMFTAETRMAIASDAHFEESGGSELLTVSAQSPSSLRALMDRYATHLAGVTASSLRWFCREAACGRDHLPYRKAFVVDSPTSAVAALRAAIAEEGVVENARARAGDTQRIAFLFTGQGSQYPGMGRELWHRYPVFRRAVQRCAELMDGVLGVSLTELLWGERSASLDETRFAQPAIFAVEYGLLKVWESVGIVADVVLGHSVGEFAAACAAGILDLDDAARLIIERGRLMDEKTPSGAMLSVADTVQNVRRFIHGQPLAIAAINGTRSVVVSGELPDVAAFEQRMKQEGVLTQRLPAQRAFHSSLMEPILRPLENFAQNTRFGKRRCDVISTVTGRLVTDEMSDVGYWVRQVREPVRFTDALSALKELHCDVHVELGPNSTLTSLGRGFLAGSSEDVLWLTSLRPPRGEVAHLHAAFASLYGAGATLNWSGVFPDERRGWSYPAIPTYPYERKRYWFSASMRHSPEDGGIPLLGRRLDVATTCDSSVTFEAVVDRATSPWLLDHAIDDLPLYPGMAYVVGAALAAPEVSNTWGTPAGHVVELSGISVRSPLFLDAQSVRLQCNLERRADGIGFAFHSRPWGVHGSDGTTPNWTLNVQGTLRLLSSIDASSERAGDESALAAIALRCSEVVAVDEFYSALAAAGLNYGPAFRGLSQLSCSLDGRRESLARVHLEAVSADEDPSRVVRLLDCLVQGAFAVLPPAPAGKVYLPFGFDRIQLGPRLRDAEFAHARLLEAVNTGIQRGEVTLLDADGAVVARMSGLSVGLTDARALRAASVDPASLMYGVEWEEQPLDQVAVVERPRGTWVIIGDGATVSSTQLHARVGHDLAWDLEQTGARTEVIQSEALLDSDVSDLEALVDDCPTDVCAVICLSALVDGSVPEECDAVDTARRSERLLRATIALTRALARKRFAAPPELWLVTRGACAVEGAVRSPHQAVVWGLGVTLLAERAEVRTRLIDLDAEMSEHDARTLFRETASPSREDRIAYRSGRRYAARLRNGIGDDMQSTDLVALPASDAYRLEIEQYGSLSNVHAVPEIPRQPAAGEVRLAVRACGLNFKDALYTLGLLQGYSESQGVFEARHVRLGFEAAGIVQAVGADVEDVVVGQAMIAMGEGLLANSVCIARSRLMAMPDGLTFEQAATLPTAFLTAMYGLEELARLSTEDTVLIHAAAGGVGQAAIQLAQAVGARVIATASRGKWAHLRAQGVMHVFDSRSLDFVEDVMRVTQGRGVDVVLNSLKGPFADASLEVLALGGRFVELGKISTVGMERAARERPDAAYHEFDLGDVFRANPSLERCLLERLERRVQRAEVAALPCSRFDFGDARRALRFLAQGKNIGKVVLGVSEPGGAQASFVRSEGAYLITGGLGGLGLATAAWLAAHGARTLTLLSRSGASEHARRCIDALREQGVDVHVVAGDVADGALVADLCRTIDGGNSRLKGVVHAAGVVVDAMLENVELGTLRQKLAAKVEGVVNLHAATRELDLDFFVAYSSAAALLPSEGQATYAAANAFLDAFISRRRGQGLPGCVVNWGLWGEVGMGAALDSSVLARYAERGLAPLQPGIALRALEIALRRGAPQVLVAHIDWARYLSRIRGELPFYLSHFRRDRALPRVVRGAMAQQLAELEPERRAARIKQFVATELARVAALSGPEAVDCERSFSEMGLDSLLALDLRNILETQLDCSLSTTVLFEHRDVSSLVQHLLTALFGYVHSEAA